MTRLKKFLSKRYLGLGNQTNNSKTTLEQEEADARKQRILEKNQSILDAIAKDDSTSTARTMIMDQEEEERHQTTAKDKLDESDCSSESIEFPPRSFSSKKSKSTTELDGDSSSPRLAQASYSSSLTASANSSMGLSAVFDCGSYKDDDSGFDSATNNKMMKKNANGGLKSTATDGSSSNNSSFIRRSNVSFDKLTIRHFGTTIIENPSVSAGPAIALSNERSKEEWTVDDYEEEYPSTERSAMVKILSSHDRHQLLISNGLTPSEIRKTVNRTNKLRKQRSQTARKFEAAGGNNAKVARLLKVKQQMIKAGTI